MPSSDSSHPCSWACPRTISNCCSIVWSLTCREVETRTYAATLMVLLLAVRARSTSLFMTLLVFEAPPQEGLVRSVPATLGVRSFHRFPAYVLLTFHRFLRAEWSQQEGMSEHRWSRQFDGVLGPGNGESGRARAAHGGSCRICLLRAVHREDLLLDRPKPTYEQGLRAARRDGGGVHLRGNESSDGEAVGSLVRLFGRSLSDTR